MSDIEILRLAYQRIDAGDTRSLGMIISEIKADLEEMQPPAPLPTDELGFKTEKVGSIRRNYKLMGDGTMVEIEQ